MDNENLMQIDRYIVTEATMLDLEIDSCHNVSDYKKLIADYQNLLSKYDLFEKPFAEETKQSDWVDLKEDDDIATLIYERGKYGIKKSRFFQKLDPTYDYIEQITNSNLFIVGNNKKYGVISFINNYKTVIPIEYDSIKIISGYDLKIIVEKEGKFQYHFMGNSEWFDEIIAPKYAGWIRVRKGQEIGWLDENLQMTFCIENAHECILKCAYDAYGCNEIHDVATREVINRCTELEIKLQNSKEAERDKLEEGLKRLSASICPGFEMIPFTLNGKMGVKDYLGAEIVPAIYDEIKYSQRAFENLCFGRIEEKWGIIAEDGRKIEKPLIEFDIPPHYFYCTNWLVVKKRGKYGLYDESEDRFLLEAIYDEFIENDGYDHIITRIANKYGFYNFEFNVYPSFEQFWVGRLLSFARFMKNGQWGYIDKDGIWTNSIKKARAYIKNPLYFQNSDSDKIVRLNI